MSIRRCSGPRNSAFLRYGGGSTTSRGFSTRRRNDLYRGVHLQPRKLTAEADMDAAAPAEALFLLTFEIEFVRVAELLRIAVGGAIHEEDRRTLRDGRPVDVDVVEGGPGRPKVDRRLEAKHLLDGARNQLRPAAQQVDGPGIAQAT